MPTVLTSIANRLESSIATVETMPEIRGPGDYANDPVGYAHDILGIGYIWEDEEEILRSALQPPYRILVKAGHSVGKTFIAAVLVNWWYDSFDPGVVISTAPDFRAVNDLLWKEIRVQRRNAGLGGMMPAAPEMRSAPDHYAKGFTSGTGDSFQGRHDKRMLFVFDEAVGVDPVFWETTATMFRPQPGHAWLAIFNPTRTNSQAYIEDRAVNHDGSPKWRSFTLDCLRHPNVAGKGPNDVPIIPAAVTWHQVDDWVQSWCERISPSEANPAVDLEWPPKSGQWWKQGVVFLIRCRGLWPSGAMETVWSEHQWSLIETRKGEFPRDLLPEMGCDVARFGDDYTSTHIRWGNVSVHHDSHSKRDLHATRMHLQALADEWAARATRHRDPNAKPIAKNEIVIKCDDDGLGGGLVDELLAAGYLAVGVGAGTRSISGRYPNKRSELWFQVADRATGGWIGLGLIDKVYVQRMRQQALAVTWQTNAAGMRVVEPKEWTKELIGRSPDDMDACFVQGTMVETSEGPRPIERIKAGEYVWTRNGYRRVLCSGVSNRNANVLTVTFSNGAKLTGTGSHPFFVRGRGWVRLDALNLADIVETCENQSLSMASSSSATRTAKACRRSGTITQIARSCEASTEPCIKPCGVITTGRYLTDATSTTRAMTGTTTTSPTSNASHPPSIDHDTPEPSTQRRKITSTACDLSRKNGTPAKRGKRGIANTRSVTGSAITCQSLASAKCAELTSLPSITTPDSAPQSVPRGGTTKTRRFGSINSAHNVESLSNAQPSQDDSAVVRVQCVSSEPIRRPVYNLTVEETPEYYANGILVHNCNLAYLEGWDMGTATFVEGNQKRDPWSGKESPSVKKIWGSR